jgi:lysophospholipid acyltransferase (LPLAT)-like uncharacterized protein
MKLRHPAAIKSAAFIISLWLRSWMSTVRIHERFKVPEADPRRNTRPTLFLFWHEGISLPAYAYARLNVSTLISNHRDGELVTQVVRFLGGQAIRGSSSRGGCKALREMLQTSQTRNLAITPDGPRGPRRVLQTGAVFLASHAGIDIVPVGIHMAGAWRCKSWDRMAIAKPFHHAYVVAGTPIRVPPDLSKEELSRYRQLCQDALDKVQALAETCPTEQAVALLDANKV